jgi:WD40 repeat protein
MGTDRLFHGPHIQRAALSPDGRIIASTSEEIWWYEGKTTKYISDNSIVLWDSATGKRLRALRVPHAPVFGFVFSPNGRQLAASFGRETSGIAVLDIESGKLTRYFNEAGLGLVRFSSDGESLLLTEECGDKLALWNIASGKRTRTWDHPNKKSKWFKEREYVYSGILSPDGKYLAWLVDVASDYSKVPPGWIVPPHIPNPTVLIIANAENDELVYRKEFPRDCLNQFAFFTDGRRFMTGGERLTAYETATGKEQFDLNAGAAYHFALSPDGRSAVAITGASEASLWNLETGKPTHQLLKGMIPASLGNFSADGKSILLVTLCTMRVFDVGTGKERLAMGHRSRVTPRFSDDDGTLITTCDELRRTWDVSSRKSPKLLREEPRNTWEGICGEKVVSHSKDGRYFVAEQGKRQLKLCETATGKVVRDLESFPHPIFGMFSGDSGRLLIWHSALAEDFDGFRLYSVATGKKTGQITTPGRAGYFPAISDDGRFVAWADSSSVVHVHDGVSGKLVREMRSEKMPRNECNDADILFTPDGSHVIVTTYQHDLFRKPDGDKWVTLPTRVFRVSDGQEVSRFYTNPRSTNRAMRLACFAVSKSGRLLALAEKDSPTIRVFDLASGKLLAELSGHREGVYGLAFSHDEQTLASGGEDALVILCDVSGLK